MTDNAFTEPGRRDRSYTISGTFSPDEPNALLVAPTDPVWLTVNFARSRWRSVAWWLSVWMPRSWRVRLCDRFGHPVSCVSATMRTRVVAKPHAFSRYDLEPVGDDYSAVRSCARCGRTGV